MDYDAANRNGNRRTFCLSDPAIPRSLEVLALYFGTAGLIHDGARQKFGPKTQQWFAKGRHLCRRSFVSRDVSQRVGGGGTGVNH